MAHHDVFIPDVPLHLGVHGRHHVHQLEEVELGPTETISSEELTPSLLQGLLQVSL